MRGAKDKRMGSPPRMRGKDALQSVGYDIGRITPAYAGKSVPSSTKNPGGKDHPRVCGEKVRGVSAGLLARGSPPRMRGKDSLYNPGTAWNGITPAYAGKSHIGGDGHVAVRDHPRVCGEKTKKIP